MLYKSIFIMVDSIMGIIDLYLVIRPSSLFCSERPSESALQVIEMSVVTRNKFISYHTCGTQVGQAAAQAI